MASKSKKVTIHGVEVEQIEYQGRWYTNVDSRVKIAEQADPAKVRREGAGYNVLSVQFVQIGDRWAYHCMVEYPAGSGVVTPGTDYIDLADKAGVAKAETSAVGRALGLHGIAIEESIASAEEMDGVLSPEDLPFEERVPTPLPQRGVRMSMPPASEQQMKQIKQVSGWLKREEPEVSSAEEAVSIIAELDQLWGEELERRRQVQKQARRTHGDLSQLPVNGMH